METKITSMAVHLLFELGFATDRLSVIKLSE